MEEHKNNIKTQNFYLSAFLISKGLELIGINTTDRKHATFLFKYSPQGQLLIRLFCFGAKDTTDILIDPRTFVESIKKLKSLLYQDQLFQA